MKPITVSPTPTLTLFMGNMDHGNFPLIKVQRAAGEIPALVYPTRMSESDGGARE
jgi:hypothetical protein